MWKIDVAPVVLSGGHAESTCGNAGWGEKGNFSSVNAFARTAGGKALQLQFDADFTAGLGGYYIAGFHPNEFNGSSDYQHCWYGMFFTSASASLGWESNGTGGSTLTDQTGLPRQHSVRITLGAVKGRAL